VLPSSAYANKRNEEKFVVIKLGRRERAWGLTKGSSVRFWVLWYIQAFEK
jgi:hypothetical protein